MKNEELRFWRLAAKAWESRGQSTYISQAEETSSPNSIRESVQGFDADDGYEDDLE